MTGALARQLLRTHVNERATLSLLSGQRSYRISQGSRDPEIGDFQIATSIDHQVGRFQIAMDDASAIVRVIERIA